MNLLIKQVRIVDPTSSFNGRTVDILISNGIITAIGNQLHDAADKTISQEGLHVSPGWVDLFADFADPGYEYRETLESGARAAAAGGFTTVCVIPNTHPVADQKAVIEYIVQKAKTLPVTILPLGAITKNTEGKELAEMYDMKQAGAVAFTDGIRPLQSAGVLVKALQYIKSFQGVLLQLPDDKSINPQGAMNEGITSTRMGLLGRPEIAEELFVARDMELAAYAGSHLHLTGISTRGSLKRIREARQRKIPLTCSTTPYHLFFCDEDLSTYNTYLKVNPPLRNKQDRSALQKAVIEGEVDCIATHHLPHETDSKIVEFEHAKNGMIGLQTAYPVVNTALEGISQDRLVELFVINPRKILGLKIPTLQEGGEANLTLFNPTTPCILHKESIKSGSKNSAFTGIELKGNVLGIFNNNQYTEA